MRRVTPDPLALDRQLCFALAATSRSVIGLYKPILDPLGLTHPQYLVMLALWERSPRTVRSIAGDLHLESATLTPLLKRLERAGYIERTRNPSNERELAIELTERGGALRERAEQVPAAVVERLGLPLPVLEDIRDRLTELLRAVDALDSSSDVS
jgi:DNA-binding MarR family transcriptional regulator